MDSRPSISHLRRTFLRNALLAASAPCWNPGVRALAQEGSAGLEPLNRFPRMMQEHLVQRVRAVDRQRLLLLESLQTRAHAEAYVQDVKERIRQSFGPFPERTPLNARITRLTERDTYRIENLIFESRPGFLVTANLYLPKETASQPYPRPGVIGTCGHSHNGKAAEPYQAFAQGLARQGYVVLIYDPIGQGERIQYPNENLKSTIGVGVREHLHAGNQQFLVDEFLGTWRAWDGVRALDYLLTREEVDPKHIGLTGNSGGGTMTTWLCGLDDRYTMAAPSCFVTSFRRNLENELPADTEQCPPNAIALGLDHEDFIAAMAPKPVIILAKERDYFDVRGSEAAFQRLQHLYRLLGAEDKIALFTGPTGHGFSQENREAMYRWFHRTTGGPLNGNEPNIVQEEDAVLDASPGQVAQLESKPIHHFTREAADELANQRGQVQGWPLLEAVNKALRLGVPDETPDYRILRNRRSRKYPRSHATTYAVETEPGIHALFYRLGQERHDARPPQGPDQAILYISHLSSDAELREKPFLKKLSDAHPEAAFYACDLRGTGESQPDTCGEDSFLQPYGSDYFCAIHSIMLGDSYPAQRTRDLSRVLQWLEANDHKSIHLVASGRGTIPATLAALLYGQVKAVTLHQALPSYHEIATQEHYDWPLSSFIPGVLKHFDLPDVYQQLKTNRQDLNFID